MAWLKILLFFLFINLTYFQTDTIFQGQHLSVGEKLEPQNKEFRLEFFSLDANKTHYIGIFYNLPSNATLYPDDHHPVWVANLDNLIPYASGMKLGRNVKTGEVWSLTSWISEDVPASGSFTIVDSCFSVFSLKTPANFGKICPMVDNIKTKLDIIPVRWSNPNLGDLNINIYGFYKVNPGSASGRGTVRNHLDPTIMAFTAYFGYSFNNLVDARAIKIG
ncbi:hypothetical protein BC332_15963 [Capsicum chinense]|nr:hypothetical protein BC332_15963 [Capsicum chinense]